LYPGLTLVIVPLPFLLPYLHTVSPNFIFWLSVSPPLFHECALLFLQSLPWPWPPLVTALPILLGAAQLPLLSTSPRLCHITQAWTKWQMASKHPDCFP
jgi:hypothetical protein